MEPIFVRERMTRDEMFRKYPNKHLVVLDSEYGIGQLNHDAGRLTGYVLAAFESSWDACGHDDAEVQKANKHKIMCSKDFTEEVFNLGSIGTCV